MQAFDFTSDDLQLNRAGKISERQHARLQAGKSVDLAGLSGGVFIVGVIVVVVLGLCSWMLNLRVILESQAPLLAIVTVIIVVIALLMAYANWVGARERKNTGNFGSALVTEGTVSLRVLQRVTGDECFMKIGYDEFEIPTSAFNLLQQTAATSHYRVYYDSQTQSVLSVEILHS